MLVVVVVGGILYSMCQILTIKENVDNYKVDTHTHSQCLTGLNTVAVLWFTAGLF